MFVVLFMIFREYQKAFNENFYKMWVSENPCHCGLENERVFVISKGNLRYSFFHINAESCLVCIAWRYFYLMESHSKINLREYFCSCKVNEHVESWWKWIVTSILTWLSFLKSPISRIFPLRFFLANAGKE